MDHPIGSTDSGGGVEIDGRHRTMDQQNGERTTSYRRIDDPVKGRHLIATQTITRGQLLFVERPLLAFQSIQNLHYNRYVCYNCKAFVNTPANALLWRCRSATTDSDIVVESQQPDTSKTAAVVVVAVQQSDQYCCIPCRHSCGYVYCSNHCENECWQRHHQLLCTGDKESNSHPIVQYKQYAIETNEILLLIAEWWISQHTIESRGRSSSRISSGGTNNKAQQYTDFVMLPWWDVVTSDMIQDTNEPSAGYINGEVITVHDQLKVVCTTAAELLNQALGYTTTTTKTTTTTHHTDTDAAGLQHVPHAVPKITALDIARRIGAMEQNAMGIRQRSPLCSPAVLTDTQFRQEYHEEFVSCLQDAGLIDSYNCDDDGDNDNDNVAMIGDDSKKLLSHDDVAVRLSKLYINEDFSVNDTNPDGESNQSTSANHSSSTAAYMESIMYNTDGDDLDVLFPPLDGTAMYSIACKMNHSCNPNVILLYRRRSQIGAAYPLVAFVVALRNIEANEELTISYINANAPYQERQKDLQNYGFTCRCEKCEQEKDLMVDDDDDDEDDDEIDGIRDGDNSNSNLINDGETRLQERMERLDSIANHSLFGRVPSHCYDPVSKYIVETTNLVLGTSNHRDLLLQHHTTTGHNSVGAETVIINLLQSCVTAMQNHDYSLCKIVGSDLESTLLQQNRALANDTSKQVVETKAWSTIAHREAFFCGALVACIGYCHDYDFITAKRCIDNALQLGLPRQCIEDFVQYVEAFARQMQVVSVS